MLHQTMAEGHLGRLPAAIELDLVNPLSVDAELDSLPGCSIRLERGWAP